MKYNRRCIGNELRINLCFKEILLMIMMMVLKSASSTCRAHICLNWRIQNTNLVLTCRVDALNFPITFYDPFKNETGFCVPHEPCISLLHKAVITKNNSQHDIIVQMPIKMQLNGWWTCKYGDNNERAVTEVIIDSVPSDTINGNLHNTECWIKMILWCLLGFTSSFLLLHLIISFVSLCSQRFGNLFNRLSEICAQDSRKTRCGKILIVFSLSASLVAVPGIVGYLKGDKCIAFKEFAIYGAIVGFIIRVLYTDRGRRDEADGLQQYYNEYQGEEEREGEAIEMCVK